MAGGPQSEGEGACRDGTDPPCSGAHHTKPCGLSQQLLRRVGGCEPLASAASAIRHTAGSAGGKGIGAASRKSEDQRTRIHIWFHQPWQTAALAGSVRQARWGICSFLKAHLLIFHPTLNLTSKSVDCTRVGRVVRRAAILLHSIFHAPTVHRESLAAPRSGRCRQSTIQTRRMAQLGWQGPYRGRAANSGAAPRPPSRRATATRAAGAGAASRPTTKVPSTATTACGKRAA